LSADGGRFLCGFVGRFHVWNNLTLICLGKNEKKLFRISRD
jgi:hypothetical protein